MSNLLKDASILLTPTAYDNGRMNAIKPYKDLYGPELVTNGDFATDSDWIKGNGTTISGGEANLDGSLSGSFQDPLRQSSVFTVGKTYKVEYTISNYVSGAVTVFGNGATEVSANGTYTQYITATITNLSFQNRAVPITCSIDNVSVVEDLSGDFQFERNSAATRVNAQGLVENVQIISSELVSNGNFSQIGTEEVLNGNFSQQGSELVTNGDFATDSDWSKDVNWSIANGVATSTGYGRMFQSIPFLEANVGITVKVSFDITNSSSGGVVVDCYGGVSQLFTGVGTHTFTTTTTNATNLYFNNAGAGANFIGSIDNVSVKEVAQNWDFGGDWTIGENKIIHPAGSSPEYSTQDNVLTIGKHYTYSVELLTGNVTNFAQLYVEGVGAIAAFTNGAGVYTGSFTAQGTNIRIRAVSADIDVEVTNISVKEVGQDWSIENTWTIGDGVANGNGANGNTEELVQSLSFDSSKKYKISYQILNYVSGSVRYSLSGGGGYNGQNKSANGTYVDIVNTGASHNQIKFFGLNFNGSVSNISVKEITDDTNIPRINYEGFSYQDTLGSEEIVNGDFSNGSANWNSQLGWTFSNGLANFENLGSSNRNLWQSPLVAGKSYKLSFEIISISSGYIRNVNSSITDDVQFSTVGVHTQYFIADNVNLYLKASSDANLSIDNVSVKEVTGQEVVPDSGCGSWLLEPQSTNLIPYSEDFSHSSWIENSTLIVTSNAITSPSGETNASRVNKAGSGSRLGVEIPITSGQSYTFSFYMKNNGGVTGFETSFDGQSASQSYTITDNWERYEFTFLATVTETSQIRLFQGAVDIDAYIWGAQLEQQSHATSYIPTNGAANTRLQDIATNSGNASLINSTEGVSYFETSAFDDISSLRLITLQSADNNNKVSIGYANATDSIRVIVRANGSNVVNQNFTASNLTDINKFAFKYKSGASSIYLNGSEVLDLSAGNFTFSQELSKLNFDGGNGANPFYGKAKALAVYKEALTDANLRCLTYPNPVATTFDLDFDTIAEQFTFTRGSEATFVNEQGLIESTNQIGPELVTNGDFATGSTGWSFQSGWSIENGIAESDGASGNISSDLISYSIGKIYEISLDIISYTSGKLYLGNASIFPLTNLGVSQGGETKTLRIESTRNGKISLFSQNFIGSIDNISVKEVISATNTPRIDYSTGEKAFLLEPQSTNLITYSEDFSDASYSKASGGLGSVPIVTSNYSTSPSGKQNADRIQFDLNGGTSGSDSSWIFTFPALDVDGVVSIYLKTNDNSTKVVYFRNTFGTIDNVTVNGNWQRYSITNPTTRGFYLGLRGSQGNSDSADLSVWGAQVEALPYATSYIPTSGASATRNQELCLDATPVINSTEGTLYAEILKKQDNNDNFILISLNNAASNSDANSVTIGFNNSNDFYFRVKSPNGDYTSQTIAANKNQFYKVALKYKSGDIAAWIDGVEVATSTNTFLFAEVLDNLSFDYNGNSVLPFFGDTKDLKYYPKALADVQLEDLTTI